MVVYKWSDMLTKDFVLNLSEASVTQLTHLLLQMVVSLSYF